MASGKAVPSTVTALNGSKNQHTGLIAAPYFAVDHFELKAAHEFSTDDGSGRSSVQVLVAIDGCGIAEAEGAQPVTFSKGDAVVIPATIGKFHIQAQWQVEFLKASVPGKELPEPATRL